MKYGVVLLMLELFKTKECKKMKDEKKKNGPGCWRSGTRVELLKLPLAVLA